MSGSVTEVCKRWFALFYCRSRTVLWSLKSSQRNCAKLFGYFCKAKDSVSIRAGAAMYGTPHMQSRVVSLISTPLYTTTHINPN